ncbi:MAG: cell division protein ZapA [Alphaproteobacteria bacterium]|nr:cell division protein ZapA [Alphaproteobacteria bacterium]
MAQVNVRINGRNYEIACDDGEEAHVQKLGQYVDDKIGELVVRMGQVGDARLLVMTALLIADELSEAYTKLEEKGNGAESGIADGAEAEAEGIAHLARRIEDIAAGLERA